MRYVYPLIVLAAGCFSPPVEAPKTTVDVVITKSSAQNVRDKVDLLFLIDDSLSMSPKQEALKARFPALIDVLHSIGDGGSKASYHIGVVTSDLGAPGVGCGHNLGGKLQQRGLAKTNAAGCQGPVGKNYIDYDQRNDTDNFSSTGQTLAQTFACMATVVDPEGTSGGYSGCGFESQLEAVYRALHDPPPENTGFLRDDAVLAIVWVTDEDDCSVDPGSDLFGGHYGTASSFLCAKYGIVCDGMLLGDTAPASYNNCHPATPMEGGKLTDLSKYVNWLTKTKAQGGIKVDPLHQVILAAITAPPTPVATTMASGQSACGASGSCANIAHSCTAADNGLFFGDPSQRLSAVVSAAAVHSLTSICDTDYTAALQAVGEAIKIAVGPSCLSSPIANVAHPDCTVEDIDPTKHTSIPFCGDNGGAKPCWRLCNRLDDTNAAQCTQAELDALVTCSPVCNPDDHKKQIVGINIERGTTPIAPNTNAQISCNTIAIADEDPDALCP